MALRAVLELYLNCIIGSMQTNISNLHVLNRCDNMLVAYSVHQLAYRVLCVLWAFHLGYWFPIMAISTEL